MDWMKVILTVIDKIKCFILMIAKQLAVTINKNNTTAVSAASKPHSRLLKSKTFISKWMFPPSTKKSSLLNIYNVS